MEASVSRKINVLGSEPGSAKKARPTRWALWSGRVLSALPVLMMLLSSSMKLSHQPQMIKQFVGKFGYQAGALTGIGLLELVCVLLYAVPRTAVIGAVLLTAYLGGAVTTHVRVGDAFLIPVVIGVLVWAGLYLRDERLQRLLPLRNPTIEDEGKSTAGLEV